MCFRPVGGSTPARSKRSPSGRARFPRACSKAHWESAKTNLAGYPTKHHSPTHHRTVRPIYTYQSGQSPMTMQGCANMLEGLAKARHPAAKAVTQTPAKQEVAAKAAAQTPAKQGATKKRSCSAGKPICMRTNEEENASLRRGASALASLRNC